MSGWAQRDAEKREEEAEYVESMRDVVEAVDDYFRCNFVPVPEAYTPEAYRKALHRLCCGEQSIGIYLEHQRLIKLNEDFYGPAHKEEPTPFN